MKMNRITIISLVLVSLVTADANAAWAHIRRIVGSDVGAVAVGVFVGESFRSIKKDIKDDNSNIPIKNEERSSNLPLNQSFGLIYRSLYPQREADRKKVCVVNAASVSLALLAGKATQLSKSKCLGLGIAGASIATYLTMQGMVFLVKENAERNADAAIISVEYTNGVIDHYRKKMEEAKKHESFATERLRERIQFGGTFNGLQDMAGCAALAVVSCSDRIDRFAEVKFYERRIGSLTKHKRHLEKNK